MYACFFVAGLPWKQLLISKQNLEYARSLLLQLEQEAQGIKIQTRKQELQKSLVEKGEQLRRFSERLQELDEVHF